MTNLDTAETLPRTRRVSFDGNSLLEDLGEPLETLLARPRRWQKAIGGKRRRPLLGELLEAGSTEPLLWGAPQALREGDLPPLVARLAKAAGGKPKSLARAAEELTSWLAEAEGREASLPLALECLAWCQAAGALAPVVGPTAFLELLERLCAINEDAAGIDWQRHPAVHQMLAGELAVALGYHFANLDSLRQRAAAGRKTLAGGILELLDGEGLPQAEHLPQLRLLVACWTRSGAICRRLKEPLLIDEAGDGFAWAVQQMIRLTVADEAQLLDSENHWLPKPLVRAAVAATRDKQCRIAAALSGSMGKEARARADGYEAPPAGAESEWAAAAVLRTDWSRRAAALLVTHAGSELRSELAHGRQVIFSGAGNPRVTVDGRPLEPTGAWGQVCWQADDDADYLELELELTGGWRVQRQYLLARDDCFLLHADAVLAPEGDSSEHEIGYRCEFPLAAPLRFTPADETSEGTIAGDDPSPAALLLPLALPEWRSGPNRGRLRSEDDGPLVLEQRQRGANLFAPLMFDLYSRRARKLVTWRQLTVADQLQIQPADAAVGYRVQLGREQWLIYRSLARAGNRTLLGHNLVSEFLVARFDGGDVDPLVEIE